MAFEANSAAVASRLSPHVDIVQDFLKGGDVSFGSSADLPAFAERLERERRFAEDIASLLRAVIYTESLTLSRMALLEILCLAVSGSDVGNLEPEFRWALRQIFVFVNGVMLPLKKVSWEAEGGEEDADGGEAASGGEAVSGRESESRDGDMPAVRSMAGHDDGLEASHDHGGPVVPGSSRDVAATPEVRAGFTAIGASQRAATGEANGEVWVRSLETWNERQEMEGDGRRGSVEPPAPWVLSAAHPMPERSDADVPLDPPVASPAPEVPASYPVLEYEWDPAPQPRLAKPVAEEEEEDGAPQNMQARWLSLPARIACAAVLGFGLGMLVPRRPAQVRGVPCGGQAASLDVLAQEPAFRLTATQPTTAFGRQLQAPTEVSQGKPASEGTPDTRADSLPDASPSSTPWQPSTPSPGAAAATAPPASSFAASAVPAYSAISSLDTHLDMAERVAGVPLSNQRTEPVSSRVAVDRLVFAPQAEYPSLAKLTHVEGQVDVGLVISPEGAVVAARALRGPALLRGSAEAAVRHWRFRPYLDHGQPTAMETTVLVRFQLQP